MTHRIIWEDGDDPEIELRVRPLREHWEARGPGLLKHVGNLLPWLCIPDTITIHLVKPTTGGGGRPIPPHEIEFAAVLANPLPMLPEVARLGWLCTRLGLPEATTTTTLRNAALIPAAIEAAEFVDLATLDEATLQVALKEWLDDKELAANDLLAWWNKHRDEQLNEEYWCHAVAKLAEL